MERFHPDRQLRIVNAGVSSDRVGSVLKRLDTDVLVHRPGVVVLYIGVNDVGSTPKESYEAGLRELVGRVKSSGARGILCTPAVLGEKTDGTNPRDPKMEEYSAISRQVARDNGVELLDFRRLFMERLKTDNPVNAENGILTYDGLHLNFRGNVFVAEQVVRALGFTQPDAAAIAAELPRIEQALNALADQRGPLRVESFKTPIRVACVGDSITFGLSIPGRETNSYPARLQGRLGGQWEVRNFGVSGATMLRNPPFRVESSYWDQPAFVEAGKYNPDAVVIILGTNDLWHDENWKHCRQFALDYRTMIEHFAGLPAHPRIWLVYPPPAFEERPGLSANLKQARTLIRQIAEEKNLPVIDLEPVLGSRPQCFPDGCHPNAEGADRIAQEVSRALTGE
jgi:lysophospholipase L1-like esterase